MNVNSSSEVSANLNGLIQADDGVPTAANGTANIAAVAHEALANEEGLRTLDCSNCTALTALPRFELRTLDCSGCTALTVIPDMSCDADDIDNCTKHTFEQHEALGKLGG
ncbi:hypothetical protein SCG7086_BI_00010 [Chlamydiales bacterium SCGC AG-110-P3]|nr:hypothetical protein SCG7086_BI_00010 [Chlamydiales bacterium SCGC AG-110-P3]